MQLYYVYMLRCCDSSYYTGVTNDYKKRFKEHQSGKHDTAYTSDRRPLELVYVSEFRYILDAIAWEKQIKRWSRKKKEALIASEYKKLSVLSWSQYRKRIEWISVGIAWTIFGIMVHGSSPAQH